MAASLASDFFRGRDEIRIGRNVKKRHATKSVKNLIMRFRGKISSLCIHFGIRYLLIRV